MGILFAISGPHGSGKTTILNDLLLSDMGESIYVDDYKVSRSVQKILGYEQLTDAYETPEKMIEFQEKIIEIKYNRDSKLKESIFLPFILTERSFLDIAIYTTIWISELSKSQKVSTKQLRDLYKWAEGYFKKCEEYQKVYDAIFYVAFNKQIKFEYDKNRADESSNETFGILADLFQGEWGFRHDHRVYVITETYRQERVNTIKSVLLNSKVAL